MKVEVNLNKRYFLFVLVGIFIFASIIATYAYTSSLGVVPNPGHALSSVQGYFSGDSSLQQSLGKLCQSDGTNCQTGSYNRYEEYLVTGTYNWIVPAGVTKIRVSVVGGGGSAALSSYNAILYGGGSGGLSISTITVTPGSTHTIIVGTGGIGSVSPSSSIGKSGSASNFDSNVVVANAGTGGGNFDNGYGQAGSVGVGDNAYSGKNGGANFGGNSLFGGVGGVSGGVPTRGAGGGPGPSSVNGAAGVVRIDY